MIGPIGKIFVDYVPPGRSKVVPGSWWIAHAIYNDGDAPCAWDFDRLGAVGRLIDFIEAHPAKGRLAESVVIETTV